MSRHRISRVTAVLVLSVICIVQAQTPRSQTPPNYPGKIPLVAGRKITLIYKYPVGPKTYECCTPSDPQVLAPTAADNKTGPVTRISGKGAIGLAHATVTTCTDLSTLTPNERFRRATTAFLGKCNQFSVYDHVICSCENFCNDANTFACTCPGLPIGQLPEVKPQDSLGSQPELIGEVCTPCGPLSSCEGF